VAKTYGDVESAQLAIGADFRHISQGINENFEIRNPGYVTPVIPFYSDLPPASMENPGAFTELTFKWLPYVSTTFGSRIDLVHTDASGDLRPNTLLEKTTFDQNDVLFALYVANEVELNENWTARLAGGYAQRPPTLMERYADGVFLAVAQNGLTRVVGDPNLDKERGFQVDLSLEGQFEQVAGRVTTFCSWVSDPITFSGFPVTDPTGAYLVKYVNGDMFVRTGVEMLGTWDLNERWTLFGTTRYLWGEDTNIPTAAGSVDQPLTGIFPLSGDVGIRLQDAEGGSVWGLEFAVRMVAAQNRTGALRVGWDQPTYDLDPNWERSTSGFMTSRIRGFYNVAENFYVVGGVENLFDRTYLEHLNQRLPADTIGTRNFREVALLSPGITPFIGCEWTF
jgi:iron complex outermembrane receptor protein